MRSLSLLSAIGGSVVFLGGCAALHHLDEYTTSSVTPSSDDVVAGDAVVVPTASVSSKDSGAVGVACETNRACTESASLLGARLVEPSVCMRATGRCEKLLSEDCPRVFGDYMNDDAIVVGTLLRDVAGVDDALERAAVLAAEEFSAAVASQGNTVVGSGRPLVVVGCNTDDVVRSSRHLVSDLRVPAIVGPTSGEDVVTVTQQVTAKGGTLVMTPTSRVSAISNLADEGLTWRSIPSDAQRTKLVIEQMNALETLLKATRGLTAVKLGIVHPTNALGASALGAVSGKLILNGRFITDPLNASNLSVDAYPSGDAASPSAIATKYAVTFKPDIVFITGDDQIANLMIPLERALTVARVVNRPYYVLTDTVKSVELLDAIQSSALPSDIKRRIRGIGARPDAGSSAVNAEFIASYAARYGAPLAAPVTSSAARSYDTVYAIAYAMAVAPSASPSGASIAQGLRTFGVGETVTVGAKTVGQVMSILAGHKSVSLRGTFSALQWDAAGDIAAGTAEVWCVGTTAGAPSFGSSGLTMDISTQVVGGAFVQCQ